MKVYKLTLNGKTSVMDDPYRLVDEIFLMLVTEEESQPITIQAVEMTEEEFEQMEEFDGY